MSKPNAANKVSGKGLTFDADALARAEAALQSLSGEFETWMGDEVTRLTHARAEARQMGFDEVTLIALYSSAHDIKGLGGTYDYPLATLLAASLCRLIETPAGRERARGRPAIVEAHVDAIRAAYSAQIKTSEHPVGRELLAELNRQVSEITADLAP
jgi:hypothetical protein